MSPCLLINGKQCGLLTAVIGGICLLILVLLSGDSNAQTICAFDQVNNSLKRADTSVKARMLLNEESIRNIILQRKKQPLLQKREMQVYTIPVVVHVLHTGEAIGNIYNPSDDQIIATINYLNEVYSGTWPMLTPAGTDAAGDIGLRFVLAKRDPGCNPTNGIDRVDMSANADYVANGTSTDLSSDVALKASVVWDRSAYYNIYVVNKINGLDGSEGAAVGGFAYFPTTSIVDGTVILAKEMAAGSKILVHEIGHAFFLYHPFEGSANADECPAGDGDLIDDTDPVSYNISTGGVIDFSCRTGANHCNNDQPYSIRTENNFMNYTSCYSLFTPGQRDRIQACILLPDRSSLISSAAILPPYEAPVCTPKINFEQKYLSLERRGTTVAGCRKYTDYKIGLNISNSPDADAVAAVSVESASTAKEGMDYSFPSGKTVLFPAGLRDTQHIVIRIYQDENVPESKLLRLGFSVNSNGGSTVAGTAIPVTDITIEACRTSPLIPGNVTSAEIGNDAPVSVNIKFFDATVQRSRLQILYTAEELRKAGMSAGNITDISFVVQKQTVATFEDIHFKMGHTTYASLVNNGILNKVNDLTEVLALSTYTTVDGWNTFKLSSPFYWNGTDNIVLELCIENGTVTGNGYDEVQAFSSNLPDDTGDIIFGEVAGCDQPLTSFGYFSNGLKPVIKFDCTIAGNPIQSQKITSRTEYLGPYAEIFFYDNSSPRKIIGKVKNLSSFNYGCTQMSIDRSGEGTAAFWNSDITQFLAQKTFFITPQFNDPSGKYELTLYFSDREKAGYESSTSQSWNNTMLIKTQVPVSDITPQQPQADKVEVAAVTRRQSYGNGYAVTAVVSTGFSGYGIGVINTALPVEWGKIAAKAKDNDVLIEWQTVSENNNSYFEVETGKNGTDFTSIATITAIGTSSTPNQYKYLHRDPASGKLYYRIRQVDRDGKSSYSPVVSVSIGNNNAYKPTLYPVPSGSQLTIDFHKPALNPVIEILSSDLKVLSVYRKRGAPSSEQIMIGHFPAGAYLARISFEGNTWLVRFIKL